MKKGIPRLPFFAKGYEGSLGMTKKIGIIGAGQMGSAFYIGLTKIIPPTDIFVCDRNLEKLAALKTPNTATEINQIIPKIDTILLAVKPQSFKELSQSFRNSLKDKLIISIMAGLNISSLQKATLSKRVIRAIPNLAVKIGRGYTVWTSSAETPVEEKNAVKKIFQSLGREIEVQDEDLINWISTISGSGPAYFAYFAEILAEKAVELGISHQEAEKIATETLIGTALLLDKTNLNLAALRQAVCSPKGTTLATLNYLAEKKFTQIFKTALQKCHDRAIEINQELNG